MSWGLTFAILFATLVAIVDIFQTEKIFQYIKKISDSTGKEAIANCSECLCFYYIRRV